MVKKEKKMYSRYGDDFLSPSLPHMLRVCGRFYFPSLSHSLFLFKKKYERWKVMCCMLLCIFPRFGFGTTFWADFMKSNLVWGFPIFFFRCDLRCNGRPKTNHSIFPRFVSPIFLSYLFFFLFFRVEFCFLFICCWYCFSVSLFLTSLVNYQISFFPFFIWMEIASPLAVVFYGRYLLQMKHQTKKKKAIFTRVKVLLDWLHIDFQIVF